MDHFQAGVEFLLGLLFGILDSIVTSRLHVIDLFENLTTWVFVVLLVGVTLVVLQEVLCLVLLLVGSDFTLAVVIVEVDTTLCKVEFSSLDLSLSIFQRVQAELLSHLLDTHHSAEVVIVEDEGTRGASRTHIRIEGDRAVNHTVFSILVAFDSLAADVFLPVNQVILVPVVEEV